MTRLGVALRAEARLQWRYRFLQAGIFSGCMWLLMLLPLPQELRSMAEPYVMLGDLAIIGWFFIAGAVFFEKGDRTLNALVATPLRFGEYLASKLITLMVLSIVIAILVATATHGIAYNLGLLLIGGLLGTLLMLLVGFISSMPFSSVSNWFLPSTIPLAVLNLPVIHFSGLWEAPWFYLIPTQGPLLFLGAAFGQKELAGWQIAYGVIYPLLFTAALYLPARWMFNRYVVAKTGGE